MLLQLLCLAWMGIILVPVVCGLADAIERNRQRKWTIEAQAREIERLRRSK